MPNFFLAHFDALIITGSVLWLVGAILWPEKPKPRVSGPFVPVFSVEHLLIEPCAVSETLTIEPGETHKVALVDLLNSGWGTDQSPMAAIDVEAKLTYYDSVGQAYQSVDLGSWKSGGIWPTVRPDQTVQLVLALLSNEGKAFIIGFKHYAPDRVWRPFQAALRKGRNDVHVALTHGAEGWARYRQEFRFIVLIGESIEIQGPK